MEGRGARGGGPIFIAKCQEGGGLSEEGVGGARSREGVCREFGGGGG